MSTPRFDWPLAASPFTLWDRLKVAAWVVRQDRYTMGEKVAALEAEMTKLAGTHALMVANGSLANQLVFETWRVKHPDTRATVIVPAVTWISSITPALSLGFDIEFCDINLTDFSLDYDACERLVENHRAKGERVIIWPTALIGFAPNMTRLHRIANRHGADLYLDACESTLSYLDWNQSILASADMVTTSCYHSHQCTSIEGGFVFYRDEADYVVGRMLRNHGLSRSLSGPYTSSRKIIEDANPSIDPSFLFVVPGTNLRPTDVHAMFGLQDIRRAEQYRVQRTALYRRFYEGIDKDRYCLPPLSETHVGFCLPIFTTRCHPSGEGLVIAHIKARLNEMGIQTRPIIGGNLLRQPCFKGYGDAALFPNAEWVHNRGAYVGLHSGVTEDMVDVLVGALNAL